MKTKETRSSSFLERNQFIYNTKDIVSFLVYFCKCRKKFIENLLIDNEELIDDYDKVVDKFVRLTDGLNYSLIDTIVEHVKRYAVVNDKKIDVVMIVDCVVDIKENHGITHYWS